VPVDGLIHSVFLVRWPVANPHYNVTCPCPVFNPDPWALDRLLIHPQEELYVLQLVIDTEGDTPSSSPLPVLPKEPASFHSNTPVIGAVPPCLRDANKITAMQACARLYLFLFIPHVVCICIEAFQLGPLTGWSSFVLPFRSSPDDKWCFSQIWAYTYIYNSVKIYPKATWTNINNQHFASKLLSLYNNV